MFYILLIKIYNIFYFLFLRIFNLNENILLYKEKIKLKQMENFNNNFLNKEILEKKNILNENLSVDFLNIYSNYYSIFIDLVIIISILIFLYYFFNNSGGFAPNFENLSFKDLENIIKVKFQIFLENNPSLSDFQIVLLNKKIEELLYNLKLGLYQDSSLDFISNQINEIFKNII